MEMSTDFIKSLLQLDKKNQKLIFNKYIKNKYDFLMNGGRLHQLDERMSIYGLKIMVCCC